MADRRPYRDDDSYRPSRPADNFRRSPPRPVARAPRGRSRSRSTDRFRARSRSPRGTGYRERARSPRRDYSPRRDDGYRRERDRSRDSRYGRSPPRRDRSPAHSKRGRDYSPDDSRGRSPPPKRDRFGEQPRRSYEERARAYSPQPRRAYSPPRDRAPFRPRSRSPRREDRVDPYEVDNWRRTSPSSRRSPFEARESAPTSRLSSPPHAERPRAISDDRPSRPPPDASPPYRARSRSPPRAFDNVTHDRERGYSNGAAPSAAPPRDFSYGRAPPVGPSSRNFTGPSGPSSSASMSAPMSAHSRASYSSNPVMAAPSHPRGGGMNRAGYGRGGDRGGYPSPRRPPMHGGPPTGPRAPASYSTVPFRGSSNSTSLTYPRTQRFNQPSAPIVNPHLADLPQVVPGGKRRADGMTENTRISKLEDEARKLREAIAEKQAKKRRIVREWEGLERDSSNAGLKAELAEGSLRALEGETADAAF